MPVFVTHIRTDRCGWIVGSIDERNDAGIAKCLVRYYPYDNDLSLVQNLGKPDCELVRLDQLRIISTQQAILLGLYLDRPPSGDRQVTLLDRQVT